MVIGLSRHRRLLVEDPLGTLAEADFSLFEAAGFAVSFCGAEPGCRASHDADVVLFDLDAAEEWDHLRALRSRYPETPVVVRLPGRRTIAVPLSADGQARALWAAMSARRRAV